MSVAFALKSAHAVGVRVVVDGDYLELEAPAQPPQAVLDLLSQHKADILRLLRPTNGGWLAEDWQVYFDERAAIAEFEGGLPRGGGRSTCVCLLCGRVDQPQLQHHPRPDGAWLAAAGNDFAIRCCPSGPKQSAMHGCIARVGRRGIGRERPTLSRHLLRWAFRAAA